MARSRNATSSGNGTAYTVRATDLTDREMVALVNDAADEEGWAGSAVIASLLWPRVMASGNGNGSDGQRSAVKAVGSRLAYMRRIGLVVRYEPRKGEPKPERRMWSITSSGLDLLNGRLNAATERALSNLEGAGVVLALHRIAEQPGDELLTILMRRAWQYGYARRTY